MIERIPVRPPSAPIPEIFLEERCRRQIEETFSFRSVKLLLLGERRAIFDKIMEILPQTVAKRIRSERARKLWFSDSYALKVRFDRTRTSIETLLYKELFSPASYKRVYAVVRCSGTHLPEQQRVYAYAKSRILRRDQEELAQDTVEVRKRVDTPDTDGQRRELEENASFLRWRIALVKGLFRTEVEFSEKLAPFSIPMQLVCKRRAPDLVKGWEMPYCYEGDLSSYLVRNRRNFSVSDRVLIAARVCSLVGRVHRRGFLLGDIKPNNILLRGPLEGTMPLASFMLCDLSTVKSESSDTCDTYCWATFAAPELLEASEKNPVRYTVAMDLWSLGVSVFNIVYGQYKTNSLQQSFRSKNIAWNWEAVVQQGAVCWEGIYPRVNGVIERLIRINPGERPLAQEAAEQLEAITRGSKEDTNTVMRQCAVQ